MKFQGGRAAARVRVLSPTERMAASLVGTLFLAAQHAPSLQGRSAAPPVILATTRSFPGPFAAIPAQTPTLMAKGAAAPVHKSFPAAPSAPSALDKRNALHAIQPVVTNYLEQPAAILLLTPIPTAAMAAIAASPLLPAAQPAPSTQD